MDKIRVAIQGIAGCFHDVAAREYFAGKEIEPVPCTTFEEMFDKLDNDASLIGIVAAENTIAGSLLQNHELIRRSSTQIVGEVKRRISHVLCAVEGQTVDDLDSAMSHPMALRQCDVFLRQHPNLNKVEHFDTAGSAREIAEKRLMGKAAICSELAADLYGLNILERGIETNKRNFTRFVVVADPLLASELGPSEAEINKSSIVFTLPHTQGALSKVLTILSFYDMNLSKIQSVPIVGREWEYRFYVNLTFDSFVRYRKSLDAVMPLLKDLKILGEYVSCDDERR